MSADKKAYFQGGGGVNQPTPKKKKYKSDPAIVVQPRFKEPFYRNYDLYNTPSEHGPGAGWHDMTKYKSIQEFLKAKRKKLKDKYKADDSWIEDDNSKTKKNPNIEARAAIFEEIIKTAGGMPGMGIYHSLRRKFGPTKRELEEKLNSMKDDNDIDFPLDDQITNTLAGPIDVDSRNDNPAGHGNLIGGKLDEYLPLNDFDDTPPTKLDFGRDYPLDPMHGRGLKDAILEKLFNKYLSPTESELFGLPDGIDPNSDLDAEQTVDVEEPFTGTSDIGTEMYDEDWTV